MFDAPWTLYLGAFVIPVIGFGLGYSLASLFRLSHTRRRTIAFETGLQNISLSVAIISLSFSVEKNLGDYLVFSLLYAPAMLFDAALFVLGRQMYKRLWGKEAEVSLEELDGNALPPDSDNKLSDPENSCHHSSI